MTTTVRNIVMSLTLAAGVLMATPVQAQMSNNHRRPTASGATTSSNATSRSREHATQAAQSTQSIQSTHSTSRDTRSSSSGAMNNNRERPATGTQATRRESTTTATRGNDSRGNDNRGGNTSNYNHNRGNDNRGNDNRGGNTSNYNHNRGNDNRGGNTSNYNHNRGNDNRGNNNRGNDNRVNHNRDNYSRNNHITSRGHDAYRDHYSWNYHNNNWSRPLPPPARTYRPAPYYYTRPHVPSGWRPYHGAPVIDRILGITFGTIFNASLNYLYTNGYNIDGYDNNVVYLRNVNMLNLNWADVMLCYDDYGRLYNAQFIHSSYYNDRSRYNRLYHDLCAVYGSPIDYNSQGVTWFGGNSTGYVTLTMTCTGSRYYTNLYVGN